MRRFIGPLAVATLLWLVPAPQARAQIGFGFPGGYQSYGMTSYGYGMPYGYGYGPSIGYAPGYSLGAMGVYSSGYSSAYVAPGTTYFNSGYSAPYGYGYPVIGTQYGYGYGGLGSYGYGGLGRSGYVSTGPFMGLPRPFAGLVRVPR